MLVLVLVLIVLVFWLLIAALFVALARAAALGDRTMRAAQLHRRAPDEEQAQPRGDDPRFQRRA